MALQHLRSGTANKRPIPTVMSAGQIAINTNEASPGLFFKDSNGDLVKVGPVHIGTTAPNSSPDSVAATALVTGTVYQILTVGTSDFTLVGASANTVGVIFTATGTTTGDGTVSGQQGVEKGEQWLDTTGGAYDLKIYDGTSWRSQAGEFVNVTGDTMTGALNISTADNLALHLTRTGATGGTKLRLENADDNSFDIEFDQNEALSLNSELVIDSSGRVLIGPLTSYAVAPCDDLQVGSNTSADNAGITIGSTTQCQIAFADSADTRAGLLHYQHSDDSMRFYTAGAANERMQIDSSGNVGIGTTSPSANLHVESSGGTEIKSKSTGDNALTFLSVVLNKHQVPNLQTVRIVHVD